jgi:hypothetical protein
VLSANGLSALREEMFDTLTNQKMKPPARQFESFHGFIQSNDVR